MIFSVFLLASSKRLTSFGKRMSSGAQVASTISVPLFFASDSKEAEALRHHGCHPPAQALACVPR